MDTGNAPQKRSWLKIIGLILVGFLVFVALIIGVAFWATSAPADEAQTFVNLISADQLEDAYDRTANQFKEVVSKDQFEEFVAQYTVLTSPSTTSFNYRSVENNLATMQGTITAQDGTVSPITVQLVQENDTWKVLNIDLNPYETPTMDSEFDEDFYDDVY